MLKVKRMLLLLTALLIWPTELGPQSARAESEASPETINVLITEISLPSKDIIYDPISDKIYASIPSSAGSSGNSVVPVSVPAGTIGTPVFVGSEPNKLAISNDGQYLYVGLDGAAAVRRVDLISQTAEIQFSLGNSFCGNFLAEDMVVLMDNPNAVAISRRNTGCSPRHEGVAIYDDGTQRPTTTPGHTGSNVIEPSESASVLYGYNNETTEFGFRTMSITSSGVTVASTISSLISGFGRDIRFDNELIYATTGAVIDPDTESLVGTYAATGLVYPDSSAGRVYFLSSDFSSQTQLKIFNQSTFTTITNLTIPGVMGTPSSLIKVGQDLLAFRTSDDQLFLLKLVEVNYSVYLPLLKR